MKRFLLALGVVAGVSGICSAVDLVYSYAPNRGNTAEHGTIALSSVTVAEFASPGVPYQVELSTAAATYYYRIDGSTINLTSVGWPVFNGSSATITGVDALEILLGPGGAAQSVRYKRFLP